MFRWSTIGVGLGVVMALAFLGGRDVNPKIEIARRLNHLLALDPTAIRQLTDYRVPCNLELASAPGVLVKQFNWEKPRTDSSVIGIRVLGLLNGLVDGDGYLCALYDDSANPTDVSQWRLLAFGVTVGTTEADLVYDGRKDVGR